MAAFDRSVRDYVTRYLAAATAVRYEHLPLLQPKPFASVGHGGAGTAYALAKLGEPRRASAWIAAAQRDPRRTALHGRGTWSGRAGVECVRAMISPGARAEAAARFARLVLRQQAGPLEVFAGSSGCLLAALALLRRREDARVRAAATTLAERILERLEQRARSRWTRVDATNFAHGWPGVHYAALAWSAAQREAPPAWLIASLSRLRRAWRPDHVPYPMMGGSWCTGAAGLALVWSKTFELTAERGFRDAARTAARAAVDLVDTARAHICCGLGGVAYAHLALDRIDPDRGWRERARAIVTQAVGVPLQARFPNGLLYGHPGLVTVAVDAYSERPGGFPLVET